MMKQITTLLLLAFMFSASAQTEKKWLIGAKVGFDYEKNMDKSDYNYFYDPEYSNGYNIERELSFDIEISKKIKDKIYFGVGMDMEFVKNKIEPSNAYGSYGVRPIGEFVDKTRLLSPYISATCIKSIGSKFNLIAKTYIKYDFIKLMSKSSSDNVFATSEYEASRQFINLGIQPALRFDMFEKFGIELTFGEIEYRRKTMESDERFKSENSSKLEMNFKPQNWLLGFYFRF